MYEIVAFGTVQAIASTKSEARAKQDKLERQYRGLGNGPDTCRVTVRRVR